MDRATLLAHEAHWDREPSPVNADLQHLTADEAALYRDLVEDLFGPAVRLEQERVRYACIEAAVSEPEQDASSVVTDRPARGGTLGDASVVEWHGNHAYRA